jgi:hypothetical protein
MSMHISSWSDEDDTDNIDDEDDCDIIPMIEPTISIDSDEENKSRLSKYQQASENDSLSFHSYSFLPEIPMPVLNEFKQEI